MGKNKENENVSTELTIYKEQGFLQKLFNLVKRFFAKK